MGWDGMATQEVRGSSWASSGLRLQGGQVTGEVWVGGGTVVQIRLPELPQHVSPALGFIIL